MTKTRMTPEERKIMGLTTASHGLVHLFEGVLPPLIPLLVIEFSTDYFHLGMIVSAFSYAFGLGSLPAGFLTDKIGPRRLISLYLFGAGLLSIFIWPVGSLWAYGVLMGLIGLFCSTYHPAANTLISLSINQKGKGFGIHGIAGSLGIASVPVLSAWFGTAMGWKAPHMIFGLTGIAVGIFSLTVPRPAPVPPKSRVAGDTGREGQSVSVVNLVLFFLSATFLGLTYRGIMTFLPTYLGKEVLVNFMHLDPVNLGGTIATVALLSGALGQYISGRLVDRYNPERLYLTVVLVGTVFVFLMAIGKNMIIVVAALMYALFYFASQPVQNFLISQYLPRHRHGIGYGIFFFLTFGVGSTAAAICGYLADRFGLKSVFYAMGLCFIISTMFIGLLVMRSRKRNRPIP